VWSRKSCLRLDKQFKLFGAHFVGVLQAEIQCSVSPSPAFLAFPFLLLR
jgi:hypothetical protein